MPHQKRRLTEAELKELREIMENAPQGEKPSMRQLARHFGVNIPSVVKSLGGWKGIKRGQPGKEPKLQPKLINPNEAPPIIQPFTIDLPKDLKNEI